MKLNSLLNDRPHPCPLPQGEGETLPAFLGIPATGLTNDAIGYKRTWLKKSSPEGKDTGEGGLPFDGAAPSHPGISNAPANCHVEAT